MAAVGFAPIRRAGGVPVVRSEKYKDAEAIIKGSLLQLDANGELIVAPADPVIGAGGVYGVALEGAGTKLNYGEPFASQTVHATGRVQEVSVAVLSREQEFVCRGVNGGTDPVTPLQTHIGEIYGVAMAVGGVWYMDIADTTNDVVVVTGIIPAQGGQIGLFIVKFLEAVFQIP